ncbi:hypothetical protein VQ643_09495 [Pseudomonas sp. F1_0610]|uniref:hypothetical protein n=1 Tax=Pseudomonas sp. F1_0610 TaxID=3114284 RepID=UPI0039C0812A
MPSIFQQSLARLDTAVMQTLNDGTGTLYDSKGEIVASEISYQFDKEYIDQSNYGERAKAITLNRRDLSKIDPNGHFEAGSLSLKLAGIVFDDGYLIAFKVV